MTPVVAPRRSGSLHPSQNFLFRASRGHIGSRFIICVSLSDCCCLFRVLIQSPGFLWWTGQEKGGEKAYIFMCVLCSYFRGVCESHSCFEEEASTFVFLFFFGSQKVPFFRGLMLGCGISFVAAKLNPHYGGFSLKINLWIFGPSADNIKMECSVFEKSQAYFHSCAAFTKGPAQQTFRWGSCFLSGPVRRETTVLSASKSSFSHSLPHSSTSESFVVIRMISAGEIIRLLCFISYLCHVLYLSFPCTVIAPCALSLPGTADQ